MGKIDYDVGEYKTYEKAHALPPSSIATWLDAFERNLPSPRPLRLIDVGSGTGRFSPALADRFGGPVVGVEPADNMRAVALAQASHPRVEYLPGRAERLPVPDRSFDAALLFFVWHHVEDRAQAADELARVLVPDGTVLVRTQYADDLPDLWWYDVWPRAREVYADVYETEEATVATLAAAGWRCTARERVNYAVAPTKRAYLDRMRGRSVTTFGRLSAAEAGLLLDAMEEAIPVQDDDPVVERGELLVFRR